MVLDKDKRLFRLAFQANGRIQKVDVDGWFPTLKSEQDMSQAQDGSEKKEVDELMFTGRDRFNAFWSALQEKAFAKLMSS